MQKLYVVGVVTGRGCSKLGRSLVSKLYEAIELIEQIKKARKELHALQKEMASPRFLRYHRCMKDAKYDRSVELTRELQKLGRQIEDLGFQLEASDLV